MNERIKELLTPKLKEWAGDSDDNFSEELEKFAELIVKECVGICLDRHHTWRWDNEPDSSSGPRDCAQSIKQHFGVEQ
jgi:hypothetical protein